MNRKAYTKAPFKNIAKPLKPVEICSRRRLLFKKKKNFNVEQIRNLGRNIINKAEAYFGLCQIRFIVPTFSSRQNKRLRDRKSVV